MGDGIKAAPHFCIMEDGVKLVSSAILGIDMESIFINGKVYHIHPPTIRRFVGAVSCMKAADGDSIKDIIFNLDMDGACKSLSWFVAGDESLYEEFLDAGIYEVQNGLIMAFSMIDPKNFIKLSTLLKNVRSLIARPR